MSILVYTPLCIEKFSVGNSLVSWYSDYNLVKAKVGRVFVEYSPGKRGYAALKLREQSYKTVTSHIMAEGPADVGPPFDSDPVVPPLT